MTIDEIVSWFSKKRSPVMDKGDAVEFMHAALPRTRFLKTLNVGACVLDASAGDGGLEALRRWPPPSRNDLRMYVYARSKAVQFDDYDGYEIGNWDAEPPTFPDVQFDAVCCSQFIERYNDPVPILQWISGRLSKEGRLYLEWPSIFSQLLPTRDELAKRGIVLSIANFHDDLENRRIHDRSRIAGTLANEGFLIEQQGYLANPFIQEEVLAHLEKGMDDPYAMQTAYWLRTRWVQYLVAVKK